MKVVGTVRVEAVEEFDFLGEAVFVRIGIWDKGGKAVSSCLTQV